MELDTFIKHFEDAVEDLESGTLTPETSFKDLKSWDSLAVLTVTDAMDMEYAVTLRKADFESAASVVQLFEIVQSKLTK